VIEGYLAGLKLSGSALSTQWNEEARKCKFSRLSNKKKNTFLSFYSSVYSSKVQRTTKKEEN
jgi:hypothetical protein